METQDGSLPELFFSRLVVQRSKQAGTPVEGREIHYGKVRIAIDNRSDNGQHGYTGRYRLAAPGVPKFTERDKSQYRHQQECDILEETLCMRQVDCLAKTAAVHGRIKNPQRQGKQRKAAQHHAGHNGRYLPQHAGNKADAHGALRRAQGNAKALGCRNEPGHVQKLEVLCHDEHGPHRIPQFKNTRNQEHNTQQARGAAPQTKISSFHFRNGSTVALILAKMASGGSMWPLSSAQSMRWNCASRSVSFTYRLRTLFWNSMDASWISCAPER